MKFIRSVRGRFSKDEIEILKHRKVKINISRVDEKKGVYPMNVSFIILEDDNYYGLKKEILSNKFDLFDERKNIHFGKDELKLYNYFYLRFGVPGIADFYEVENCRKCYNPIIKDNNQYHFKVEPTLPSKFLFGRINGFENIIITDLKRANLLRDYCDIKSHPIYFGSEKLKSLNYVGITIPIATKSLNFESSKFGEVHSMCSLCGNTYFNGAALELFPSLERTQSVNIFFTREIFIPFLRPIIVSNKFAEFLVDYGMINWGPDNLIPVKGSEKYSLY